MKLIFQCLYYDIARATGRAGKPILLYDCYIIFHFIFLLKMCQLLGQEVKNCHLDRKLKELICIETYCYSAKESESP